MIGVLLKKQIYERLSYFKRNRKNVDVAGMFLSLLLAAVVIFIVALVFTEFVKKYLSVRLDNVIDVSARCYELMTLIYEIVFVVSVFGSVTSLTRAVFESDDRNVLVVLPIKSSTIFITKMISAYFGQAVLCLCVSVPLVIVFATAAEQSAYVIAMSVVAGLIMPFISLGVASILTVPYYFIKRFLQSRYVTFLLAITAIMGVGFWCYSEVLSFFEQMMVSGEMKFFFDAKNMEFIINLTDKLVPANFLANLVLGNEIGKNAGILVGIIVGLGALGVGIEYLLYNSAVKIRVQNSDGFVFARKKLSKPRSVRLGLLFKEIGSILFTPDYAFQYISVAAILPVMVYFCMGLGADLLSSILSLEMNLEIALFITVLFGALTNTFCAINISREGRSFYMQKTLPIKFSDILGVKILLNVVVTLLSVGISTLIITVLGYISYLDGLFVFFVGVVTGVAQICFATRKDLNKPHFSTEEDNTVKEGNGNVSAIIMLGMIVAVVLAGVPLFYGIKNSFEEESFAGFTYLFAGLGALIVLGASLAYTFIGLRKSFERITEGD